MAIMVKSADGMVTENVATNGKANAALGLGIAGTALGLLNNTGLFGGVLGNRVVDGVPVATAASNCVDVHMYYRDMINQLNITNAQFSDVNTKICNLGERVAVNETANAYQNRITDIGFANVDNRFATENIINEKNLALATCRFVPGQLYLSPTTLADNYIAPTRVLESHEARSYGPISGGYGWNGYDDGGYGCTPCGR